MFTKNEKRILKNNNWQSCEMGIGEYSGYCKGEWVLYKNEDEELVLVFADMGEWICESLEEAFEIIAEEEN